jgi:transposase InsO family protein
MTSGSTREFMALCAIHQHFGRPGTPTDQAWIESLFGHVKAEWPHLAKIGDPAVLRAELAVVRQQYNTVRLHAGIGYVTPDDEHQGRGPAIQKARQAGLEQARLRPIAYHRATPPPTRPSTPSRTCPSTPSRTCPRSPAMLANQSGICVANSETGLPSSYYDWHRRGPSTRQRADRRLLGDIRRIYRESGGAYAELPTDQGTLYLVAIVDGCSRVAVGHAMGERATAEPAISAVELGVSRRQVDPDGGLVHHSDQGGQFHQPGVRETAEGAGIRASMGSVGDCFDHAFIESLFATLECELIDRRHWRTREEARLEVFWWLEAVYTAAGGTPRLAT